MPVIILLDLDANNCPPELLRGLNIENKHDSLIINIAVDEAESWLMADRIGFAKYFAVDEEYIPQSSLTKLNGNKKVREMDFPAKSSWCLTHQIIPNSKRNDIKKQMLPVDSACKGKEYNSAVVPYIKNNWDINEAMRNSDSLRRMVDKIKRVTCQL